MCQAVLGDQHKSLKHSEKLLAIFKIGTLIIVSVGFQRLGQDCVVLRASCFSTFAHLRLSLIDIFSQEVFFDHVSTKDFDNFKTCKIVTVTLFIIFNSEILLNWLQTHRGRTLFMSPPSRPNLMLWHQRSSKKVC